MFPAGFTFPAPPANSTKNCSPASAFDWIIGTISTVPRFVLVRPNYFFRTEGFCGDPRLYQSESEIEPARLGERHWCGLAGSNVGTVPLSCLSHPWQNSSSAAFRGIPIERSPHAGMRVSTPGLHLIPGFPSHLHLDSGPIQKNNFSRPKGLIER